MFNVRVDHFNYVVLVNSGTLKSFRCGKGGGVKIEEYFVDKTRLLYSLKSWRLK